MTKYKTIKLKRLYNGIASVRDYIWQDCIKNRMGIIFECNNATMKLEPHELLQGQHDNKSFDSKFKNQKYKLIDFKWESQKR